MVEMLTLAEAAKIARCAPNTIKTAIAKGQLKGKDIGFGRRHFWRLERSELLRWLGVEAPTASA
jgi:hypothetical protein